MNECLGTPRTLNECYGGETVNNKSTLAQGEDLRELNLKHLAPSSIDPRNFIGNN